jgi:hypothetical protein
VRAWGVYFPPNGKFYAMGGRRADDPSAAQFNPLEFTPSTNTWVTKTAVFSDNQTSNLQGGVLTVGGTPMIVVVGGSAGGGTGGTTETRHYNPVTDQLVTITTDPWTPGTTTVPGGSAIHNNKLYILGGFDIPGGVASDDIWEYDPARPAGSRWVQKAASLPTPLSYIPAATIGNYIYTGGGSLIIGGGLEDSDLAFRYDPVADTITTLPALPQATGETRGLAYNGELWVLGGGRIDPNPSNNVYIYNPTSNAWRMGPAFTLARRNFPADTDGTRIYMAGGYAPTAPTDNMEIFTGSGNCPTAVPTTAVPITNTPVPPTTAVPTGTPKVATETPMATNTAIPTNTTTPTVCPFQFVDVPPGHTFYPYVRCLVCRFIISGYADGTFRPNNNITRGQISKMVSNSAGFSEPAGEQIYEDVNPTNPFYVWIQRLTNRGYIGGYPCGTVPEEPCVEPLNRPYFRPSADATRGQLSKIVATAAQFNEPVSGQFFTDVPKDNPFYVWIQRLALRGIMGGYPCGGINPQTGDPEPCDSENRPYFRWGNFVTRGQASKIVAGAFFPNCYTPARPAVND